MASNKISKSVPFMNLTKHGKEIAFSIATITDVWTRPEAVALAQGPAAMKALIQDKSMLPTGTASVTLRENLHPSKSEPVDHYDICCYDMFKKYITTIHVKKETESMKKEGTETNSVQTQKDQLKLQLKDQRGDDDEGNKK